MAKRLSDEELQTIRDLVSDLEEATAEVGADLFTVLSQLLRHCDALQAEVDMLNVLFSKIKEQLEEAADLWQNDTGNKYVHPGFGELIDWLIERGNTTQEKAEP